MSVYKGRGIYKGSGIYKSAGIYNGNGIYNDGEGGGEIVLPPFTLRFMANRAVSLSDFRDTLPITLTLVDDATHTYDLEMQKTDWANLFRPVTGTNTWLIKVIAANISSVLRTTSTFQDCTSLTSVPLIDTSSIVNMSYMFKGCTSVERGALALYTQARTQTKPPNQHIGTFSNCGVDTETGLAELQQIPTSWGGQAA